MAARTEIVYLVVSSSGEVRVGKRPRVLRDEVSVRIRLKFPDGWGSCVGDIDIDLPEPPTFEADGEPVNA